MASAALLTSNVGNRTGVTLLILCSLNMPLPLQSSPTRLSSFSHFAWALLTLYLCSHLFGTIFAGRIDPHVCSDRSDHQQYLIAV